MWETIWDVISNSECIIGLITGIMGLPAIIMFFRQMNKDSRIVKQMDRTDIKSVALVVTVKNNETENDATVKQVNDYVASNKNIKIEKLCDVRGKVDGVETGMPTDTIDAAEKYIDDLIKDLNVVISQIAGEGIKRVYLFCACPIVVAEKVGAVLTNGLEVIVTHFQNGVYYPINLIRPRTVE